MQVRGVHDTRLPTQRHVDERDQIARDHRVFVRATGNRIDRTVQVLMPRVAGDMAQGDRETGRLHR